MKKLSAPDIAVLYHAECPDGFGGSFAAWKKFGKTAIYIPVYHDTSPPEEIWRSSKRGKPTSFMVY